MGRVLRIALPPLLLAAGGSFLVGAFEAAGRLAVHRHLNDPSEAEFYELDRTLHLVPVLTLIGLGCVLIGRWWHR
ncbi:MAG: hypothetical protein AAFU49_05275 [Pseudomonadota bacterium]